jgi:lipopolysaccharide export system protein LptA
MAAGLITLAVVGIYVQRSMRQSAARRKTTYSVAATIQQQSSEFSFSKVEQDRTLFTVRASHATQFKDQDRALLEDVWITVYGRTGNRNDNIHTRECSYVQKTGEVRCQGEVQIELQGAKTAGGPADGEKIDVTTRDLSFNQGSGEASTAEPVEFKFAAGHGRGVGVAYSTHDSTLRIQHSVELDLTAGPRTDGMPVSVTGDSLEVHRDQRVIALNGPATVREGARELTAGQILVELDEDYDARRAVAKGHPMIRATVNAQEFSISAGQFEAVLNPDGWVENIVADGKIAGTRKTPAGTDRFSAAHVEFSMLPEQNLLKEMTATGGVIATSEQGTSTNQLKTDALRVTFSTSSTTPAGKSSTQKAGLQIDANLDFATGQRIESAETLAPATVESKNGNEVTNLKAKKFVAQIGADGRLDKLLGHSEVEITRQVGSGAPQTSSADELAATFGPDGQWSTLEESGSVRVQEGDRRMSSAHATFARSTGLISLDGSPVISDSSSQTSVGSATINQNSGELHATGGIVSTYLGGGNGDALNLGTGPAHIHADTLSGSSTTGHVVYAGHARLWQGESVMEADQIELWRDEKKMQATGHVVAIFPQGAGPSFALLPARSAEAPMQGNPQTGANKELWTVHAPSLTYFSDRQMAHLEGGVVASSQEGSLESHTLDVFLGPGGTALANKPGINMGANPSPSLAAGAAAPSRGPSGPGGGLPGGQLSRVLAQGNVVVRQADRRGLAEQAEYTAADEKFVLSGGKPTLTDASGDTTTGHSLTFFVASDTIFIDSQEGSRTLTKHRVEK